MTEAQDSQVPGAGTAGDMPPAAGTIEPPVPAPPAAGMIESPPPVPGPPVGWAQPQPTMGGVQPGVATRPVTILARLAGLFLVLLGLAWGAIGALLIVGGSAFRAITDQFGPLNTEATSLTTAGNLVGGVIAGLGVVILVLAIVEVLGGIGALLGRTWGRILGIGYSLVFGAFLLMGLTGGTRASELGSNTNAGTGLIVILVMFLLYLYSLVVLLIRWRGSTRT